MMDLTLNRDGRLEASVEFNIEDVEEVYEDQTDLYGVVSALALARLLRDGEDELSETSATRVLDEMALIADWMLRRGKELTPATVARLERMKDCPGKLFDDPPESVTTAAEEARP